MLIINPPYQLAQEAETLLPALSSLMGTQSAGWRADWLVQS